MSKGVCVFDLDNTLGDFGCIDYFSYIYDIESFIKSSSTSEKDKHLLKEHYKTYSDETKKFLKELQDTFESNLDTSGIMEIIFRPGIDSIIDLLVKEIDKKTLGGCIIYSNNGNPYNLQFAGRAFERQFHHNNIFISYLDRTSNIRDEYDVVEGRIVGSRKKTIETIKKAAKNANIIIEESKIAFVDDLIHPDIASSNAYYIHVKPYHAKINDEILEKIFNIFEGTLYDLFKKYTDTSIGSRFFTLYHIKHLLHLTDIEELEFQYYNHSKNIYHAFFHNDYNEFESKIKEYIHLLQHTGGKKRRNTLKHKKKIKSIKKNRTRF